MPIFSLVYAAVLLAIFTIPSRAASQDQAGWSLLDVGSPEGQALGRVSYGPDGTLLEVESNAPGFSINGDELTMVGKQVEDGNSVLEILMTAEDGVGWQGITMRKGLDGSANGVFLGFNPDGKLGMLSQPDGKWLESAAPGNSINWLKLEKQGQTLTGSYSGDGNNWIEIGKLFLDGPEIGMYSGVAVAGSHGNMASALFGLVGLKLDPSTKEQIKAAAIGSKQIATSANPKSETSIFEKRTGNNENISFSGNSSHVEVRDNTVQPMSRRMVIYVDNVAGNDVWDGKLKSREPSAGNLLKGPKRSMKKAVAEAVQMAVPEVEIVVQGNTIPYSWTNIPQGEKIVVISTVGTATFNGPEGAEREPVNVPEEKVQ